MGMITLFMLKIERYYMIHLIKKSFAQLSKEELYKILKSRMKIFILEQQSFYLDLDNKDQQAVHFIGMDEDKMIAYARVIESDSTTWVQRICVAKEFRNQQIGSLLMNNILEYIDILNIASVELDAQVHLQQFYRKYEFQSVGDPYDDGGIMHIRMRKNVG